MLCLASISLSLLEKKKKKAWAKAFSHFSIRMLTVLSVPLMAKHASGKDNVARGMIQGWPFTPELQLHTVCPTVSWWIKLGLDK